MLHTSTETKGLFFRRSAPCLISRGMERICLLKYLVPSQVLAGWKNKGYSSLLTKPCFFKPLIFQGLQAKNLELAVERNESGPSINGTK